MAVVGEPWLINPAAGTTRKVAVSGLKQLAVLCIWCTNGHYNARLKDDVFNILGRNNNV